MQIQIKCLYLQSCSKNRPTNLGEVVEWSITAVLKTVELKGSGGSNPSLSANNLKLSAKRWAFFVQGRQELAPVRTCAGKAQRPKGRELQIVCKGPRGERKGMWRTQCGKSHGERGILARAPPARRREKARTAWLIPSGERKGKDNLQPPPTSDTPPHPGRAAESYRLSHS